MVPNPAPKFSPLNPRPFSRVFFLSSMAEEPQYSSGGDFTTAKRKYDDSATQQLPSSGRRSIRFSAPIIHSQSHDSGPAYNSLAPPVDEIEIAKQKAQEIVDRLFNSAEAKRSKFENGGGFDSNDSKGFGSAPTAYLIWVFPEPALGINFARDGMPEKDGLALVVVHGDAWLLAAAFYFGARFGFDKADRKRLFSMINDLPTIFEVVSGAAKKLVNEKSTVSNNSSNKSKSNSKAKGPDPLKFQKPASPKDDDEEGLEEEDEEGEHGDTLCGSCGENYASDEFWICCDICEKWFHGVCVKITPTRAEHIKHYKCPACTTNKRARP